MTTPEQHMQWLQKLDFQVACNPELFDTTELELLRRYGAWMEALATGKIDPVTDAQVRFLAVANGRVEPQTEYELVWSKLTQFFKMSQANKGNGQDGLETGRMCGRCGGSISPDRLEVFPNAPLCRRCQEDLDQGQNETDADELYCPRCADRGLKSRLVYRQARDPEIRGQFLGCASFPDCRYTEH